MNDVVGDALKLYLLLVCAVIVGYMLGEADARAHARVLVVYRSVPVPDGEKSEGEK